MLGGFLAVLVEKMFNQKRNVLFPGPEWWNTQSDDIDPIKEITAEIAGFDLLFQVPARGRNEAKINID